MSCDSDAATGSKAAPTIARTRTTGVSWLDSGPSNPGSDAPPAASYQIGVVTTDRASVQMVAATKNSMIVSGRLIAT